MPSLSMYKISAPSDPKEFENLLLDYSAVKYGGAASLLGRQGQAQHGIDVVVIRNDYSIVCVQCKDVKDSSVTTDKIDQWIKEAEVSPIPMKLFVIAVAIERDAKIQEYLLQLMVQRVSEGKFPVEIVFWDDIEHFIKCNDNMLRVYYPFLYQERQNVINNIAVPVGEKYPELIQSEDKLRDAFFNELVKYHIQEMIEVDVFVGFPTELVISCDSFEISIQQLMYRAVAIEKTDRYIQIHNFMRALNKFSYYLSMLGEYANEYMIRVKNPLILQKCSTYRANIEMLRSSVMECLEEIKK